MSIILKPGREKSVLRRHPWIFSSAVQQLDELSAVPGSTVDVISSSGRFLARAAYSPNSQIRARVWTFADESVNPDFFRKRIRQAIVKRQTLNILHNTNSCRLIHAESDGIPGLIVDRYDEVLVLQSLTAGLEFWKETVADILLEETGLRDIYERSDVDVRELEGLPPVIGILRGSPQTQIQITEYGLRFVINIRTGHKTGFYLDQRDNRHRVGELARDREVLNCFCYTGGFTIHALAGGAKSVLSVDTSTDALIMGQKNTMLNNLQTERTKWVEADVFNYLRKLRDQNSLFDMIILDPPKFAPTIAQAGKAARGYKDINLLAFKLLQPGGILVTFSCSGGVDENLFQKIVASAALDAGVEATIIGHLSQGADHPVSLHFPEGRYLKGMICLKDQ